MRLPATGVLSRQGATPIPAPVAWAPGGGAGGWNSPFAGATGFFDAPPARTAADTQDCLFDIPNVQNIAAAGTYLVPPGEGYYIAAGGATIPLEIQTAAGTWTAIPAGSYYWSDGYNVRAHNTGAAAANITFYPRR